MSSNTSATGKDFFRIDPRLCALIVIDMQNAFVSKGDPSKSQQLEP
jgi:isochorismate hydrolase